VSASGRRQRAQAVVWLAAMLPFLLAVVGVALDGALLLSARRDLQDVADAAARAGASQVDLDQLRADSRVVLRPDAARQAAYNYAVYQGVTPEQISAEAGQVVVVVRRTVPTSFLGVVQVTSFPVEARGAARARAGVARPEP
jgi:uncharacterized membrane protein